jgi:ATP-binding cassette subfamily F protein 2
MGTGNYDTYMKTREELEDAQMKKHKWEQDQIAHMKEYIARFGHGSAKLARQAQSKEKTLEKMVCPPFAICTTCATHAQGPADRKL